MSEYDNADLSMGRTGKIAVIGLRVLAFIAVTRLVIMLWGWSRG